MTKEKLDDIRKAAELLSLYIEAAESQREYPEMLLEAYRLLQIQMEGQEVPNAE